MPPLLSAIMIVKNEEANLPRCLESLRSVCDEICIMDTGSEDRSLEIAKSFGSKVSSMAWTGDESDARNAAFQMATGQWIISVDADEAISPELAAEIREKLPLIDCKKFPSASVVWRNHYIDQSTSLTRITRMGRRSANFRFTGRIHPTADFIEPTFEFSGCLDHFGYLWTPEQRTKKSAHMLEHLRPYISGEKPDLARLSQYITYLLVSDNSKEFHEWLKKILSHYTYKERLAEPYWRQAVPNILQFLADKDDFETGFFPAHEILENFPDSAGTIFYLLQGAIKKRDWPSAISHSEKMLNQLARPIQTLNIVYPETQKPAAEIWQWLAKSCLRQGDRIDLPSSLLHYRNLSVILFATSTFPISTTDTHLASLLKIYQVIRNTASLSEWARASIGENIRTRKKNVSPRSLEHLFTSILFIEFCSITGNMSEGILMAKETLETYSHVKWLAALMDCSSNDWRFSANISKVIHFA